MTDLQTIKKMLDKAGITYEEDIIDFVGEGRFLAIKAGEGLMNLGYCDFWSEWTFNNKGELLTVGSW